MLPYHTIDSCSPVKLSIATLTFHSFRFHLLKKYFFKQCCKNIAPLLFVGTSKSIPPGASGILSLGRNGVLDKENLFRYTAVVNKFVIFSGNPCGQFHFASYIIQALRECKHHDSPVAI